MAGLLVGYVEGDQAQWPLPELCMTSAPDPLLAEERWVLMDQVLGEIALLADRRRATSHQLVSGSAGWFFSGGNGAAGEFARVHAWLAARRASIEGDAGGFLTHGIAFFAGGPGYLRQAWREFDSRPCCFLSGNRPGSGGTSPIRWCMLLKPSRASSRMFCRSTVIGSSWPSSMGS